jgi:hypothetical protein
MYGGGLLGPMGGGSVAPLLPELAGSLRVTPDVAALSLTTYLVPFAVGRAIGVYGGRGLGAGPARPVRC